MRTETMQIVEHLARGIRDAAPGPWSEPPRRAAILPIRTNVSHQLAGILVLGISARLPFDDSYRDFFALVTTQIATAIANARAHEEERRRAEALASIDRAKTAFFSNVSHEFRTPLTLILGPLEDALANHHGILPAEVATNLTASHRNALRLLKLVNTLLDFSRIEKRTRPGLVSADRRRRSHRRASQQFPIPLRESGTSPDRKVPAKWSGGLRLCGSGHVGEDRPQSAEQRVQVHAGG